MLLGLRTYALFLDCTCGPASIDNFKTSRITQINRSTDLNMRRGDINSLVDPIVILMFLLDIDSTLSQKPITRISDLASLKIF